MAELGEHHYCPKCRDDLKGDDPCANSADCVICSTFSEAQKKKIRNRNRYKSKKDQNSSVFVNNSKDCSIDDSLLDEDESAVSISSQVLSSQKNRSLEDKLDRFREEDSPAYSDTLETNKKCLDLEVKDVECFVPPVFSGRDQVKKSVQQSMALPPAQPLVELWKYKEFSALGSNSVDDNDPHHPPLSKGQFLSFPKPQMRFYQVSPQSFSLAAHRIQDAFKNIASPIKLQPQLSLQ